MRFLSFILAILVLGLSTLPCSDIYQGKTKAGTAQNSSHKDDGDHKDACSPFCQCSCCATYSITSFIPSLSLPVVIHSNTFSSYLPSAIIDAALPIWQPPQLG